LFFVLILLLISIESAYGIYLNFEQVDSAPHGASIFKLYDIDNDDMDEIIFKGNDSTFLGPYCFFIYDFTDNIPIYSSEPVGGIIDDLCPTDINDDGYTDIIYSFYCPFYDFSKVAIAYGPDYENHNEIFSRGYPSRFRMIRQQGSFRDHEKPIYFKERLKLFVIGDDFALVDSIDITDYYSNTISIVSFNLNPINETYSLALFSSHHYYHEYYEYVRNYGYFTLFNEILEVINNINIYDITEDYSHEDDNIDGRFMQNIYNEENSQYMHVLGWFNYKRYEDNYYEYLIKVTSESNEPVTLAEYENSLKFINAFSVDYIGDGYRRFLTLEEDPEQESFYLKLRDGLTGGLLGEGTAGYLNNFCQFGDWDTESGKEIFIAKGNTLRVFKIWESTTSIAQEESYLPQSIKLYSNFPNPFNSATTIRYSVAEESNIRLEIFNLSGQQLETLLNCRQPSGEYQVLWDASKMASGIYFYQLTKGDISLVKKMNLIK
jgi:hypothetical protein